MKKNIEKYLQGVSIAQLILTEKNGITNLCRATPDFRISQLSSSRIQTYVRKFNLAIYASITG
jgi:hypothetical protein